MDNLPILLENSKIKEYFQSKITWDLLLLDSATKHKDSFNKIRENKESNIKIGNITTVKSELYPGGEYPSGEKKPGSRIYRLNDFCSTADYYFEGDELNPKNGLIIFTKGIQYGRTFRQLCGVLKNSLERNLETMDPPTLACIGKLWDKEHFGKIIGNNLIVPVIKDGWTYLPTLEIMFD